MAPPVLFILAAIPATVFHYFSAIYCYYLVIVGAKWIKLGADRLACDFN